MNQAELTELLLAAQVRQLAVEMRQAKLDLFEKPATPGQLDWAKSNPLDSFIPLAVEELRHVATLVRVGKR